MELGKISMINEKEIYKLLDISVSDREIDYILQKSQEKKGLELQEAAKLLSINDNCNLEKLFKAAGNIKEDIYGSRIVLFAPLYCSNFCVNDCDYCSFHSSNKNSRKKLTMDEIGEQVKILEDMGHKRLLLEFGEHPQENTIDYVVEVIDKIYNTKSNNGEIRRVNVNIAATTVENYKKLKQADIGTYQLFQETYHQDTYEKIHRGPKADYQRQIGAMTRAFEAGLDDLGIGVLFGLYDYRFETLAMIQYAYFMDSFLGVGPHTISVPRFQSAHTVNFDSKYKVNDQDFLKIIAILRLAVPYAGIIISTRENPQIRKKAFDVGVSQASAASRAEVNGYKRDDKSKASQFHINDHRSLDEVVRDICLSGYLPSFCTSCYRSGRTGDIFMQLAKTGTINKICQPNALLTFKEFLLDYASFETRKVGEELIEKQINLMDEDTKKKVKNNLKKIDKQERDLYL